MKKLERRHVGGTPAFLRKGCSFFYEQPNVDEQYQNAVQAVAAILLPIVREDLARNGHNDYEAGRGAR